jgi:hypothetical protein
VTLVSSVEDVLKALSFGVGRFLARVHLAHFLRPCTLVYFSSDVPTSTARTESSSPESFMVHADLVCWDGGCKLVTWLR